MSEETEDELVKILIDLPNHWATGGESVWAKPLGNDEYEIRNTPFYAYGINFGDIVEATEPRLDLKPIVRKIVRPSGNRTLRIYFSDGIDRESQIEFLEQLAVLGLNYERATGALIALDIHAGSDYGKVCDRLWALEQQGVLEYETCEPRAEGRFDDGPADDEEVVSEYEN